MLGGIILIIAGILIAVYPPLLSIIVAAIGSMNNIANSHLMSLLATLLTLVSSLLFFE